MSGCDGHSEECREALDHLFEYLDGELSAEEVEIVSAHFQGCGPCHEEYDVEEMLKVLVRRSCSENAPDRLRERIRLSLVRATMARAEGA